LFDAVDDDLHRSTSGKVLPSTMISAARRAKAGAPR
jgi:hypothetical protein